MVGIGTNMASWVTALTLSCGSMIFPAWASPPFSRPTAGTASSRQPHLDLRPPSARDVEAFPAASAEHPTWGGLRKPGTLAGRDGNPPAFGADVGQVRVMSPAESFARRVHREGLPLARLWENHSALVSLGLNAKGKPGLWLVQKTH
jgi:hypothetical protein